jgi:aryl-alcohol dehydrogenase-like predicted oxidoreductase/enamine deaminase RidA (YjgF/YER057c/UK114 family)
MAEDIEQDARVERIELAPGFSISRVLTGLWQIADMEREGETLDPDAASEFIRPYVEAGFTTYDMADHYGSSEVIAGRFRKRTSGDPAVELLTKWVPKPGPHTRDDVRTAVQLSLDRMEADRIDLLQFHAWSYADPGWLECLFWLQELKDEGLIGHLGLTNVDTAHLRIVVSSDIEVVSNQVCYSLIDQRARAAMTDLCVESGVKLLAFGTVAGGLLTEKWLDAPKPEVDSLDTWSQMKYWRFIDATGGWDLFQGLLRAVRRVADKHGVSMANVACRHILEQPAVGGVIIGARLGESEHIEDNLKLFDFSLDAEDSSEIESALSALGGVPGDCGDEYRKPPFLTASGDLSHHFDSFPSPYPREERDDGRSLVLTGTMWEDLAGFSRAVRRGSHVWISGTTATLGSRAIGGADPAAQTHFVIDKIEGALQSLGGSLEDVVRTRVYVPDVDGWEPIARAHGERFRKILPANTLVHAGLVGDEYLVEIEAEAFVQ